MGGNILENSDGDWIYNNDSAELEGKISRKEKEIESAKVELKKTGTRESILSQQNKILKLQEDLGALKDQLKDLNQK